MFRTSRSLLPWLTPLFAAFLAGCSSSGGGGGLPLLSGPQPSRQLAVVLDGSLDEWPASRAALADAHYLYVRLAVEGEPRSIQASDETITILIDADANAATGVAFGHPAEGMGVDLEIRFSPRREDGSPGRGVEVVAHTAEGTRMVPHTDLDLSFAPTHAAEWYELRMSRLLPEDLPRAGLASSGRASGMIVLHDSGGRIAGWSEPFAVDLGPASSSRYLGDAELPRKPRGAVRIVSWNVEHGAPMRNAGPFANVIHALEPDVVLVQEWTLETPGQLRGWFTASLPTTDGRPWQTRMGEGWGVGIATPHRLEAFGPSRLDLPEGGGGCGSSAAWCTRRTGRLRWGRCT